MSSLKALLAGSILAGGVTATALAYDFGRPATPEEIKLWDIDVRPDGKGLPPIESNTAQETPKAKPVVPAPAPKG